ncbi:DNA helicase [Geodermatophilus sp. TF02-6]|uniref:DUF3320 domain-containing protein n=1 Tax=Geodermatophilus sp. TF02-6 TaxID=2250575 RepID=UPI000DEB11F4|nr:DUF3320 domain-containing protein [Geodermatophilus sp. TF02-6]RBY78935.1 DNA helicase [Geodermatophilus sp. TF02-6]
MSAPDLRPTDASARPAVAIQATTTPVLSYALAHNRVPLVSRLAFTNHGGPVRGATVRLGVRDTEGPIGSPVELTVDLDAGQTTVRSDVGLVVDPAAVLQIEEQRPGSIEIDLLVDGEDVGGTAVPVQVLAANQWLAAPVPLALEVLAAHVLPHHPSIGALVDEVSTLLGERTGSAAVQGHRSGPERVDEIVAAVCEAVRRRRIRATEPQAGWADVGQRVRTPGDVLDGRVGTCLDTAVTLAAALERAGVRPLLWLTEGAGGTGATGHAFCGYWREERGAESAATTDVAPLVDLVDRGSIRLVETTLLTTRGSTGADLHGAARTAWLAGDLDRVLGVTDVHRARRDGIVPLPARTRGRDGAVQVVEYDPAVHSVAAGPVQRTPTPAPEDPGTPARVQRWKADLLDLSLRNRLIDFTERAGLPLAVPPPHLAALEDLLRTGTAVSLLPSDRIAAVHRERGVRSAAELPAEALLDRGTVHADVTEGGYLPRLRTLAHRARTVLEETGANALHLALGSLFWELDGRPLRSPLVLLPVVLTPSSRTGVYRLTLDDTVTGTPNHCLLEKLRQVHGLTVPGLTGPAEDGPGTDVDRVLRLVREALADAGLPHRVEPTADLAVLPFAGYRLWEDLDEHWADFTANPLVHHLVHAPTEPFADPVPDTAAATDLDELAARCPLPADAYQLRAVAEAAAGRTFVLEGPPGTGKSQTITNLLARAVADGKRVLFVAQKRAALDVVARRLEAVDMGPFVLDLHGEGRRAAAVRARIGTALEHAVAVDGHGLAADGEDLRRARRTLTRYADRLHARNAAGLSYHSARTAVLAVRDDVPPLPLPPAFVAAASPETVTAVRRALALLPDIADLVRPSPRHAWAFVDTAEVDLPAARQAAAAVDRAVRDLPAQPHLAGVLREVRTPADLDALAHLLTGPAPTLDVLDEVPTARWAAATTAVLGEVAAFTAAVHPGLERATAAALELPLAELYVAAQTAQAARWWARRRGLRAVRDRLRPVLRAGVTVRLGDVPELVAQLWRVQTAGQGIVARASVVPGLAVPAGWNPVADPELLVGQVEWLERAGAVADSASRFAVALRRWVVSGSGPDASAGAVVARLRDALAGLLRVCRSSPARLAQWCGDDGLVLRWQMTRPERGVEHTGLMSLRRWAGFVDTLEPLRAAGLHEARALLLGGELPADDAVRAFESGMALASLAERRGASDLESFDAAAHEQAIARFTAAAKAVREHLRTALPAAVLAARPVDAAGGDRVAALQRELVESRRGPGVRGLLARHGDLVTAVTPCVLASPESVARFLPAEVGLFDLVVFDEASQIRVADAVGALGRARAAVVVGDSRQMPPTSPTEPSSGAAEDDAAGLGTAVEDEESILSACVRAQVPRQELSWHYRSQDESLIAFSNATYYGNRLSSFPAPTAGRPTAGVDGRGISLVRVEGTFHRTGAGRLLRTNPMEAKAVVAEVRRRFDAVPVDAAPSALPSIGVVTFTAQQRACIEGLLHDAGDERLVEALDRTDGAGLFVKTVADVQGDERDVVLLSTGFSADDRGRLPLHFGPLNRVGGERRLNVAVTRARRQVVVFSSFDPSQLRAEQTSSVGVKHLRAYLDLAALGSDALPGDARPAAVPDPHREEVAAALRERGLVVRTDVGLSRFRLDLSLARPDAPDTPVVAVLLDGPAWAARRTVGDRDGLPVEVLSGGLRWPAVERVWLPAWLCDREAVLDRLVAAVDAAPAPVPVLAAAVEEPVLAAPPVPAPAEPPAAEVRVAVPLRAAAPAVVEAPVAPAPEPARRPSRRRAPAPALDGERPFVPWTPKPAGDRTVLDSLADPRAARAVRRVVAAGLRAEGPVHADRLVRLAAGAFGLSRVGGARRDALLGLLPPATVDGAFVWPASLDRATWTGFRRQAASAERPLEHVAPEEVGNAMAAVCRAGGALAADELFLRTAEVFGHRRRTPSLTPLLEAALTRALEAGRLVPRADGSLTLP